MRPYKNALKSSYKSIQKRFINHHYLLFSREVKMKVLAENLLRHEVLILIGAFIALGTLIKILGSYDFSSDWFWFLTGLGLLIEG